MRSTTSWKRSRRRASSGRNSASPYWRPIKYSLFPPLGLATLAAYLDPHLDITLQDEHVEPLDLDDDPDLVIVQVYITNAYRAYRIADHYRRKGAHVALGGLHVTSLPEEAAPHADTIFLGPGEDTFPQFLRDDTIELAAAAGLRSLFVGFETLSNSGLQGAGKKQNLGRDYRAVINRLDDLGIMINGSFVFGLDGEDRDVFKRTVEWAVTSGITTATFHILTPYPGTQLHSEMSAQRRLTTANWDLYDTRHVVYRPSGITPAALKAGYDWAYGEFYRWGNILTAARAHHSAKHSLKHFVYSAGWKKFEPAWDVVIRLKQLSQMRPLLEAVLSRVRPRARTRGTGAGYPRGSTAASPQVALPSPASAQTP